MFKSGERVLVSVSGGPDSTALLVFLAELAPELGLVLEVFHLDHMLRGGESAADAEYVRRLSERLDLRCHGFRADVEAAMRDSKRSPEDAAREVRLWTLASCAREVRADRIATGHTADDQVETFLMRMLQGAGLSGLAGMAPVCGKAVRPLIEVWHSEVTEFCDSRGLRPRIDSTNLQRDFLRNRIRLDLLPYLESEFGESVKNVLLREVESLATDNELFVELALEAFERVSSVGGGEVRIERPGLLAMPEALRRGVLRHAWRRLMPAESSLLWIHVMDIMDRVVWGDSGACIQLPGGVRAEREYDEIVFTTEARPPRWAEGGRVALEVPGVVKVPGSDLELAAEIVDSAEVRFEGDPRVEYARADIEKPLTVRPAAPGDRFRPLGAPGTRKVAGFLKDSRVPRRERENCLLVLSGEAVVWVVGHRLDERFRLGDSDRVALRLRVTGGAEYDSSRNDDQGAGIG